MVEPARVVEAPAPASKARICNVYSPNFTALIISRVRGRGRLMEIFSSNRPGLAYITKTRSDRNTAS